MKAMDERTTRELGDDMIKGYLPIFVCVVCLCSLRGFAASPSPQQATLHVNNLDLPIPTEDQAKWQDLELGMFIHFDIEIFDKDYQTTHPRGSATSRWARSIRVCLTPQSWTLINGCRSPANLAAKYACFTCKHSSGFLMWQSDLYPYGVKQSPWKDGKGDVVQEYLASCRKFGIEPGLYCSAGGNSWWQLHHAPLTYRKGNLDGKAEDVQAFLDMDRKMYEDLWSKTGPVIYMWFDGGVNPFGDTLNPLIEKYLPHTVCFNGPEMGEPGGLARWSGNEKGFVGYPLWNTIDVTNDQRDRGTGSPEGKFWLPVETDVPLRYHVWLWQKDTEPQILSLSAADDGLSRIRRER